MTKQDKKRKTSLGVLFWIAAILLILVVFLFNRSNIEQVMESTGLVEVINQRIGMDGDEQQDDEIQDEETLPMEDREEEDPSMEEDLPNEKEEDLPNGETDDSPSESGSQSEPGEDEQGTNEQTVNEPTDDGSTPSSSQETNGSSSQSDDNGDSQTEPQEDSNTEQTDGGSGEPGESEEGSQPAVQPKVREFSIYLVHIDDAGDIRVRSEAVEVEFTSSPLTRTLETLFEQPQESQGGSVRNLIPSRSRIHRVWVDEGVAYIDVNESFRFNPIGMEGHRLQLAQVINTATQFPTVDAIRILIDGERFDFLGGEGTFIGKALYPGDYP